MDKNTKLTRLIDWLAATGRSKSWVARQAKYSYQQTHAIMVGKKPLSERFVVACFEGIEGLPVDVFEAQGYVRGDGHVYKRIPLKVTLGG